LLSPRNGDTDSTDLVVDLVKAPKPPVTRPSSAPVDPAQAEDILRRQFLRSGAVEAGHFVTLMRIGRENERKACAPVTAVCDADSGYAYHVDTGAPGSSTGELLVRALLGAMKNHRFVPREIRVRNEDCKRMLADFAEKFDAKIIVKPSLPSLDEFERGLREKFGDPGNISY
jgi:hypothetical protein